MPRRKFGTHWEVCAMLAALGCASNFSVSWKNSGEWWCFDEEIRMNLLSYYIPIRSIGCNLSQMSHGIGHLRNGASSGPTHRSSWAMGCANWGVPKCVRWPCFPGRSRQFTRIPPNGVDGLSKEVSHFCREPHRWRRAADAEAKHRDSTGSWMGFYLAYLGLGLNRKMLKINVSCDHWFHWFLAFDRSKWWIWEGDGSPEVDPAIGDDTVDGCEILQLPSGNLLHSELENHHF